MVDNAPLPPSIELTRAAKLQAWKKGRRGKAANEGRMRSVVVSRHNTFSLPLTSFTEDWVKRGRGASGGKSSRCSSTHAFVQPAPRAFVRYATFVPLQRFWQLLNQQCASHLKIFGRFARNESTSRGAACTSRSRVQPQPQARRT